MVNDLGLLFERSFLNGVWPKLALQVFALQLFFEFAVRRIDSDSFREDVDVGFNRDRRESAVTTVVNVIDRRGQHFLFESFRNFGRSLRMLAPFNFQLQVMRRYAAATFIVARAFVDQRVHASDKMIGAETGFTVRSAPELAIDDFA